VLDDCAFAMHANPTATSAKVVKRFFISQ
jgi:hypothetical protein